MPTPIIRSLLLLFLKKNFCTIVSNLIIIKSLFLSLLIPQTIISYLHLCFLANYCVFFFKRLNLNPLIWFTDFTTAISFLKNFFCTIASNLIIIRSSFLSLLIVTIGYRRCKSFLFSQNFPDWFRSTKVWFLKSSFMLPWHFFFIKRHFSTAL